MCWKRLFFPIKWPLFLPQRSVDCISMYLFLGSLIGFALYLYVLSPVSHCLHYYSLQKILTLGAVSPPVFVLLLQYYSGFSGSFCLSIWTLVSVVNIHTITYWDLGWANTHFQSHNMLLKLSDSSHSGAQKVFIKSFLFSLI